MFSGILARNILVSLYKILHMTTFNPFSIVPYLQPNEDSCVATILKTVCDNQFNFKITIKRLNNILREKHYLGIGSPEIHKMPCYGVEPKIVPKLLNPYLKKWQVKANSKVDCKLKDIETLLINGIYPYIYYPMNKLDHWVAPDGWKTKPMVNGSVVNSGHKIGVVCG